MSECHTLWKKNDKSKLDLLVSPASNMNILKEYGPFISRGNVSLIDTLSQKPVTILRGTGALQSLTVCYPFTLSLILV